MDINLIGNLLVISFAVIISIIVLIFLIRDKIKKKNKPESQIKEIIQYHFADERKEFGTEEWHRTHAVHKKAHNLYRIIFMIILGLMLAGILTNMIHLIIKGGFTDYSWAFYVFLYIVFIVVFNIAPIMMWGYKFFARTFSKGTIMTVLTLSVINGLRGLGLGDPVINYNLISARFLIGLMTAFLPWIYIFMWITEIYIERRDLEKAKESILIDQSILPIAYKLPKDEELDKLMEEENKEKIMAYVRTKYKDIFEKDEKKSR